MQWKNQRNFQVVIKEYETIHFHKILSIEISGYLEAGRTNIFYYLLLWKPKRMRELDNKSCTNESLLQQKWHVTISTQLNGVSQSISTFNMLSWCRHCNLWKSYSIISIFWWPWPTGLHCFPWITKKTTKQGLSCLALL